MSAARLPIIVLPGAGGGAPDCAPFCNDESDRDRFIALRYPNWKTYVDADLTADALVDGLAAEIMHRLPGTSVVLLGHSIGGHFAYATALRLEDLGHSVAGVCIIDTGTITAARSARWKARLTSHAADLLRRGHLGALARLPRQLAWRGLFRLAGDRLPALARNYATPLHWMEAIDPAFAEELSMRLLIRITATSMRSLDEHPAHLRAPAVLLRTRVTASSDSVWRRRCPDVQIFDVPGNHETLFEVENIAGLRTAFLAATAGWRDGDHKPH
jgi:thioesterase domain-containing protein